LIGCSNFETNKAFIWAIEAARLLAGGIDSEAPALKLLTLASKEIRAVERMRRPKHAANSR
jgi:hypothetical protein